MALSKDEFDKVFGIAWHTNGAQIRERLTFVEYAGNPTNNVTPTFVGQECFDTANSAWYRSTGLAAANWVKLSP